MNISELIAKLEKIREEHGDLTVVSWNEDDQAFFTPYEIEIIADLLPSKEFAFIYGDIFDARAKIPGVTP